MKKVTILLLTLASGGSAIVQSRSDRQCVHKGHLIDWGWPTGAVRTTTNLFVCQHQCSRHDGCELFDFRESDGQCRFFKSGARAMQAGYAMGQGKCDVCRDDGIEYRHRAIDDKVVHYVSECKKWCDEHPRCHDYIMELFIRAKEATYANVGRCYRKDSVEKVVPHGLFTSWSKSCERDSLNPCIDFNVFYHGWHKRTIHRVTSAEDCRRLCEEQTISEDCEFYSFQNQGSLGGASNPSWFSVAGTCLLKHGRGELITNHHHQYGVAAGFFDSGPAFCSRLGYFDQGGSTFADFKHVATRGAGIATTNAVDVIQCQEKCDGEATCYFFNFLVKQNHDNCQKLGSARVAPVDAHHLGEYVIGWKSMDITRLPTPHPCQLSHGMLINVGFHVFGERMSMISCWAACLREELCGSVNYDRKTGRCALSSHRVGKKIDTKTVLSGAKCG